VVGIILLATGGGDGDDDEATVSNPQDIQAAGLEVYGVSMQDATSHKAFIDKYNLPFPLVVDTDGAVAKAFRVPTKMSFASRQSFLIGKDGKIKQVWLDVNPKEHAAAILAAAKS